MKIIDLLVKIANSEEVPNKIKIGNDIYWFDINDSQYTRFANNDLGKPFGLLEDMNLHNAYVWFNLDVEIIEKIEKPKFEIDEKGFIHTNSGSWKGRKMDIEFAKALNYLLEKSDSND